MSLWLEIALGVIGGGVGLFVLWREATLWAEWYDARNW